MIDRRSFLIGAATLASIGTARTASATPTPGNMTEGRIYCERCHADVFPTGGHMGPDHLAVRLMRGGSFRPHYVTLDGEHVEERTIEAYAGRDGWVIMEREVAGRAWDECPDCTRLRFVLVRGDVSWWPMEGR